MAGQRTEASKGPRMPLAKLRLLPLIAGTAWILTLSTLLIYWLAEGRPRYPGQSNPYVAFISDIGAFRLQSLFISGGTITSICLLGTIVSIHHHFHYGDRIYTMGKNNEERRPRYKQVFSVLAVLFAALACPCQIALTVFDNHGRPHVHRMLLFLALAGTAVHAVCTAVVFWDEMRRHSNESMSSEGIESRNGMIRRKSVVASNLLLIVEVALGVAFTVLLWMGFDRVSGIIEWTMALVFTFYFWAFVGFLLEAEGEEEEEGEGEVGERTALL